MEEKISCQNCKETQAINRNLQQIIATIKGELAEADQKLDGFIENAEKLNKLLDSKLPEFPFGPIPHWINVDERKPEPFETVLLCGKDWIGYGVYRKDQDCFVMHPIVGKIEKKGSVTHWMSLPSPPEIES